MQKVAAYILERRDNLAWPEARASEVASIRAAIDRWLESKGRSSDETSGKYEAEDGSHAVYCIEQAADGERSWWMVQLHEETRDGRIFRVTLSVTNRDHGVVVYLTMEVGTTATLVSPIEADPRCPQIVRSLLGLPGRWYHGTYPLLTRRTVRGFEAGEGLAAEIADPDRTVPIIVVTGMQPALPGLDERLGYDLAGLANVVHADPDATWALTDELGKQFSCYDGAVRLYWPRFRLSDSPFRHPLWTAVRLQEASVDLRETRDRFRRQVRQLVMGAAALSVVRPRAIDEIRNAASRRQFAEMKAHASSLEDYQRLADSFAQDNDKLREDIDVLYDTLAEYESKIADLETKLQNAAFQRSFEPAGSNEIVPDLEADDAEDNAPPAPGEVRFYKKRFAAPKHDVMVRAGDCGCDNWEGAHAADKARKGIARLEGGRSDWSSMQHCASCTGGGMWRVRW